VTEKYTLVGQTPVPCEDLLKWARWFEENDRHVAETRVMGTVRVSTDFLGLDHAFLGGPPLLFETMAFWPGEGGHEETRSSTWLEAEEQHREMVREVTRPRAFWAFCRRRWRSYWKEAANDWRGVWRELRGMPPSEWDRIREAMDRVLAVWREAW
jgi:hypothetical protein